MLTDTTIDIQEIKNQINSAKIDEKEIPGLIKRIKKQIISCKNKNTNYLMDMNLLLADLYLYTNKCKYALRYYYKVYEVDNNSIEAILGIADSHYFLKMYEQSYKWFSIALKYSANSCNSKIQLQTYENLIMLRMFAGLGCNIEYYLQKMIECLSDFDFKNIPPIIFTEFLFNSDYIEITMSYIKSVISGFIRYKPNMTKAALTIFLKYFIIAAKKNDTSNDVIVSQLKEMVISEKDDRFLKTYNELVVKSFENDRYPLSHIYIDDLKPI